MGLFGKATSSVKIATSNTPTLNNTGFPHISEELVEEAGQALSAYLIQSSANEVHLEYKNLSFKGKKLGSFQVVISKINEDKHDHT